MELGVIVLSFNISTTAAFVLLVVASGWRNTEIVRSLNLVRGCARSAVSTLIWVQKIWDV